jgi:hypothetical protein
MENAMTTDLSRYIVNPGPKVPVSGLTARIDRLRHRDRDDGERAETRG